MGQHLARMLHQDAQQVIFFGRKFHVLVTGLDDAADQIDRELADAEDRSLAASQPTGADIFVDGQRQQSETPTKLDLPAGTYRIAVRKTGFEPYVSPLEIKAGEPAHVDAVLSPLAQGQGWVVARTVPRGAEITVDGVVTNQQTPAKLDLSVGQHLILFSLAGYTAESSVIVRPGKGSQIFQVLNRP